MQRLYENLFYSKQVNELFTTKSFIKFMLQFESTLAMALAQQGLIPIDAAKIIEANCLLNNIDIEALIEGVAHGGNPAIPLIKQLTDAVKIKDLEAAKYVHFGATSQDVIDTAMMLQFKAGLKLIVKDIDQLMVQLQFLIEAHRHTVMMGRTFMQHAKPITFGFKAAGWLDGIQRSNARVQKLLTENIFLQLGGATGTLFGMENKGLQVAKAMGKMLEINTAAICWHTQRDRLTETAATLGILTASVAKIAKDISLLMQTEIAEVSEPAAPGKGGSSTMPHKRNPVGCIAILANANRLPALVSTMLLCQVQDQERGTGSWHAEWETMADIVQLSAGALHQACIITNGLEVNKEKMLQNIEFTNGLIFAENISLALAKFIGKSAAHTLLEEICTESTVQKIHLKQLVLKNKIVVQHLSPEQVNQLFEPANSLGMYEGMIDSVLANNYYIPF